MGGYRQRQKRKNNFLLLGKYVRYSEKIPLKKVNFLIYNLTFHIKLKIPSSRRAAMNKKRFDSPNADLFYRNFPTKLLIKPGIVLRL